MKADSKTIVEVVSAVGVIASLLFVGVQVRQGAEATRAATVLELKNGWLQFNLVQAENPEISRAYLRAFAEGFDNVDEDTQGLVGAMYRSIAHNWSNAYYQYRLGTLELEQWEPVVRDIELESEQGVLWRVWADWNHVYDDPFRAFMDSVRTAHQPSP